MSSDNDELYDESETAGDEWEEFRGDDCEPIARGCRHFHNGQLLS
jgi:hypothetical protein